MLRIHSAALAATVVLVLCASASNGNSGFGRIYTADEAERFSAASYAHDPAEETPYWTPGAAEIQALETALPAFLAKSWPENRGPLIDLAKYRRQYFGLSHDGHRVIFVNAFCGPFAEATPDWGDRIVVVFDGGGCFFQVYYEPSKKQFHDLRVNGVG